MDEKEYPYLEVCGSPYELGLQHGEAIPERIHLFLDRILKGLVSEARTKDQVLGGVLRIVPLLETHCPDLLPEIQGLADGAELTLEEAALLQLRGEAGRLVEEACTTFAIAGQAAASGDMFIGQNSDMNADQEEVGIMLHLVPQKGPRILLWTFAGHLGYHGMNSDGVAHFANALGGGPAWRFGLSHYPLKRRMLECRSLAEIFAILDSYPVCSSGNYMLCDGAEGFASVEMTPDGYGTCLPEGRAFLAHTNHFLCSPWATEENYSKSSRDSFSRLERMNQMIEARAGRIALEDVKGFLSDHLGWPVSICRHPESSAGAGESLPSTSKTVCSLIALPGRGELHVCRGNPCEGAWKSYEV